MSTALFSHPGIRLIAPTVASCVTLIFHKDQFSSFIATGGGVTKYIVVLEIHPNGRRPGTLLFSAAGLGTDCNQLCSQMRKSSLC